MMFKFIKNYFKTKKLEKENAENARAEIIKNMTVEEIMADYETMLSISRRMHKLPTLKCQCRCKDCQKLK